MVTDHNHASMWAQKISPTRADEESDKQKMRRDEKIKFEQLKKGAGPRTQKIIIFLGDLHVPWFRADTPIGRLKRLQLTDNRAIEKRG